MGTPLTLNWDTRNKEEVKPPLKMCIRDSAYDAVKELPGVIEMNGGLQLAGQGVTVILDGKVTTLSTGQL